MGDIIATGINAGCIRSAPSNTGFATTTHTRAVIASTASRASNNRSAVIASGDSDATGNRSAVIAAMECYATGGLSACIGGEGLTASAAGSVAIAGEYANANNPGSAIIAAEDSSTSASFQLRCRNLSKVSGSFQINHPDPAKTDTHTLTHCFVESPTAGDNLYRFVVIVENGEAVIELPAYYKHLNTDDQVWVTPQGHFGAGYGEVNEDQTELKIFANADGKYNVLLIGTRKDKDAVDYWQGVETYR